MPNRSTADCLLHWSEVQPLILQRRTVDCFTMKCTCLSNWSTTIYFTAKDSWLFYTEVQLIVLYRTKVQPFILHRRTVDCFTLKYSWLLYTALKCNHLFYTEVHSLFCNEVQLIVDLKHNHLFYSWGQLVVLQWSTTDYFAPNWSAIIYFTAKDSWLFYNEVQLICLHRTEVQPFILHRRIAHCFTVKCSYYFTPNWLN